MLCCPAVRRSLFVGLALVAGLTVGAAAVVSPAAAGPHDDQKLDTVLDHKVQNLDGAEVDLAQYRGKVVLIVNVASQCGFTKQYKPLEKIYERYRDEGFVILGFPCNQFGGQEPGSPAEIAAFCEKNYGVQFPLMGKVEVKGDNASPLYQELTAEGTTADPGPVKWNFEKFLVGRDGRVIERFRSQASPDSKPVVAAIKAALKAEVPADAADAEAPETAAAE
ncbi:glutathione peroxidase [Alienimonas californiensis]|uniref:Glutathione peroxidase n=1 Tax=Alienimonas californiensis TaxID=2527989 RepID=A0A517P581_9PLAN|nr:Hydroperoxy fatty acid reductase gpx1 [Alienimonas californiensis]